MKQQIHRGGELSIENSTDLYQATDSITLPKLEEKTEEVMIGGMNTSISVPVGWNKMAAEIKLVKIDPVYLTKIGLCIKKRVPLRWMASMDNSDSCTPSGLNALMRGRISSVDLGNQKSGEKVDVTLGIEVDEQYLLRINDVVIWDIQPQRLVFKNGEEDLMEEHRKNMGYLY